MTCRLWYLSDAAFLTKMNWTDLFWHVAGFIAPALFLSAGLTLAARLIDRKAIPARPLRWQFAINFGVGCVVLAAGLALTGHDGRIVTYAALALACAASQAWQMRGGQRGNGVTAAPGRSAPPRR
jgi:hypothetical protein